MNTQIIKPLGQTSPYDVKRFLILLNQRNFQNIFCKLFQQIKEFDHCESYKTACQNGQF